jgi:P27 family predicted phage terminase small subunit
MPGRRPNPLRLITGTGNRPIDVPATIDPNTEIETPSSITDADHDPNYALEMWTYLVGALSAAGIIEASDRYALELTCLTYAQYRAAQIAYEHSPIVTGSMGQEKRSPHYDIMNSCRGELRKQLVEFGLTPAARVKLGKLQPAGSGLRHALNGVLG